MKMRIIGIALGAMMLACAQAQAGGPIIYGLSMDGSKVVGGGDSDGTGNGTITFDLAAGQILWSIAYSNLEAITGWGIGIGAAGSGITLAFPNGTSSPAGSGVFAGSANFNAGIQSQILGLGDGAFFVIKTTDFPNGAVRDQFGGEIPVPGAVCIFGLAGIAANRRRR